MQEKRNNTLEATIVPSSHVTMTERYFLTRVFQGLTAEASAEALGIDSEDAYAYEVQLLRHLRGDPKCLM